MHHCLIAQTYPDLHASGAAGILWQSGQCQRATTTAAVCQGHVHCRSGWRPGQGSLQPKLHIFLALQSFVAIIIVYFRSPDVHSIAHVVQVHAFVTAHVHEACSIVCAYALLQCAQPCNRYLSRCL